MEKPVELAEAAIYWNNIVKKLREEARKLKEQEMEQLRLLQETTDFINECNRHLDYMEKMFFEDNDLVPKMLKAVNITAVRVGDKIWTFYL